MLDSTIKTYATRQAAALIVAAAIALGFAFSGPSSARTGSTGIKSPPAAISGFPMVVDGDTLHFGSIKVRLEGIDAPEHAQTCLTDAGHPWPCGQVATRTLAQLAGRGEVRCEERGADKYGRVLGICFAGAVEINAEMVRLGQAWAFVKFSDAYVALEADARRRRAGIWQGQAQPAWEYRAGRWQTAEETAPLGCAIKGNVTRNERIYHMPWSPWYAKIRMDSGHGKRWFCSEDEAINAGWRPALAR
jgi:endonuclease YncB( thermonuclease family)